MNKTSTDGYSAHTAVGQDENPNHPIGQTKSRFHEHDELPGSNLKDKGQTVHDEGTAAERDARSLGLEPGSERRKKLERRLKLKLDLRFSILVVIYSE